MNALQGIWTKALEEYQELEATSAGSHEPQDMFCMGYLLGVAFGLALSTVRPDLAQQFEPQYRERGWLQEHEGHSND